MGIRSIVSVGLIAIPIATTLGVLFALDAHRSSSGQTPLFQDNSVTIDQYCQKAYGITPPTNGQQYTCEFSLQAKIPPTRAQGFQPLLESVDALEFDCP